MCLLCVIEKLGKPSVFGSFGMHSHSLDLDLELSLGADQNYAKSVLRKLCSKTNQSQLLNCYRNKIKSSYKSYVQIEEKRDSEFV